MANTLTGLIPVIYEAMDVVPRELMGAIPAVSTDFSAASIGINQSVRSPVVPVATTFDIAAGVTNTNNVASTIGYVDLLLTKSKAVGITWTGEEQILLGQATYSHVIADQFRQAFRTLGNLVEADVVAGIAAGASRAVGTAGATPFGTASDMSDFSNAVQVLDDNGASQMDRSMILGNAAANNIRAKQSVLVKVNESGSSDLLRTGAFNPVFGLNLRTSGQIGAGAAVGTGSAYVLNGAHAKGATSIVVKTGSGTILAGDVLTINNVKYVVTVGVAAPGTVTIAAPGLQAAGADGNTVTINAASVKNVYLQKSGFVLATRVPAMPEGGDSASDVMVVTDPVSNLSFQIAMYKQYRQTQIDIGLVWGTKVIRPEYCGLLLG